MFERVNKRIGMGLGLLNGLLYLVLISLVIYDFSYWTTQMATSDDEKWEVKMLNKMGHDLQDTGLIRTARAIDPMPEFYFKAADLAGLVYQNPQLVDRISTYPAFLSLSERDDFKKLGEDTGFQTSWKNHSTVSELWNNPQVTAIRKDENIVGTVENLIRTNLDDFQSYLQTGKSTKFGAEQILGRWDFNVMSSLTALIQTRTNFSSTEMQSMRDMWSKAYAKTMLVAGADSQVFLKNLPHFKAQMNQPTTFDLATSQGQWKSNGNDYDLSLTDNGASKSATATLDGSHLTVKLGTDVLVFDRE